MRRALLGLLLAVCGCQAPMPGPPPYQPPPTADEQAVSTLAGHWRVAGIDGRSFDETYGLALSADDKTIWWAPRCAGYERSYELDGIRARFRSAGGEFHSDGSPRIVCQIGVPSRLPDVFRAIDSADRVIRTPSNGIEISGGGHSLTLFSQ
jgi:hypothetical protein